MERLCAPSFFVWVMPNSTGQQIKEGEMNGQEDRPLTLLSILKTSVKK